MTANMPSGHGMRGPTLLCDLTRPPRITLSDVARAAGCSVSFVSACAHGRRKPTAKVRAAAERLLGRPADELFAPAPPHEAAAR